MEKSATSVNVISPLYGENTIVAARSVAPKPHAAGTLLQAPTGEVLFLLRCSTDPTWAGYWNLPGGMGEPNESAEETAKREMVEEIGRTFSTPLEILAVKTTETGLVYTTFIQQADSMFTPVLCDEHAGYAWAKLDQLPEPMHPGLKATLTELHNPPAMDATPNHTEFELALDRASVRRRDEDGHMFVDRTPISKANICPYYGYEIPDWEAMGLEKNKTYYLFRHPDELKAAAPTFAGKPLLLDHTAVSADDHPADDVVGAVGDDVRWEAPYLTAPLRIWAGHAIAGIESKKHQELSSAYRYRADMTPGKYEGQSYDGVMRDIRGNHVAIVKEGRAGPDVVVGDSTQENIMGKKTTLSRTAVAVNGALNAYLAPKLAQDAKVDFTSTLQGLTGKNYDERCAALVRKLKSDLSGKLAADAQLNDLSDILAGLRQFAIAQDGYEDKPSAMDADEDEDEDDKKKAMDADGDDDEDDEIVKDSDEEDEVELAKAMKDKKAMDAAIQTAVRQTEKRMMTRMRDIREAEALVEPYVGKMAMAHDSAESVLRTALGAMGVDGADTMHVDALRPVLSMLPKPGSARTERPKVAADSAAVSSFNTLFPNAPVVRTV